jgi:hypothetical protein
MRFIVFELGFNYFLGLSESPFIVPGKALTVTWLFGQGVAVQGSHNVRFLIDE